jgi:DHA3 family macrolide efflux protein-like MFS transporter
VEWTSDEGLEVTADAPPTSGGLVKAPSGGFRGWTIVWTGQFASMLGSSFTSFSLAVFVYSSTGSATTLGLILALGLLPGTAAAPFAGSLVDRWGSKRALLVSNLGAMAVMAIMAPLLTSGQFQVWQVYAVVIALSGLGSLQGPALGAMTPQLVPKLHLGRANGMRMIAIAASQVLAPVSAGALLLSIQLRGIVIIDICSYGVAILCLLPIRVPRDPATPADGRKKSLLAEFGQAWRYVADRKGLLALLTFLATVNFAAGVMELLISPLILTFGSSEALGIVLSVGGVGMILAGAAVTASNGPRRRVRGVLIASAVMAVATVAIALRPNVPLIAASAFVIMGSLVFIATTHQVIWQTKVERGLMGRVMALIGLVGLVPQLFGNIIAGVAADRVFVPWVGQDHVDSPAIAAIVGQGPGRGIALLLIFVGLVIAVCTTLASLSPRLRGLEAELPDVESDEEPEASEQATSGPVTAPANEASH